MCQRVAPAAPAHRQSATHSRHSAAAPLRWCPRPCETPVIAHIIRSALLAAASPWCVFRQPCVPCRLVQCNAVPVHAGYCRLLPACRDPPGASHTHGSTAVQSLEVFDLFLSKYVYRIRKRGVLSSAGASKQPLGDTSLLPCRVPPVPQSATCRPFVFISRALSFCLPRARLNRVAASRRRLTQGREPGAGLGGRGGWAGLGCVGH